MIGVTAYAHGERLQLVSLLRQVGPDAPTLCEGWDARDLVAHLLARERRPDSGVGLLVRPLAGWSERVRHGYAEQDWDVLLDLLAAPPWWSPVSNPLTDELVNTMEMFLHHEDVRRARPEWQPRDLPIELNELLWRRLSMLTTVSMRRLPVRVTLAAPEYGERTVGAGPHVRLTGPPGELLVFASGRQDAARLSAEGPSESVQALREARFAM
ncbi:TIGR03085 family protein [Actinocatenispora comari]|uniref:TIGR03085 family protein n=1 Tax=Actinocatenispora comari TaxID=2807577 RepID=A0A8J4ELX0_9ACTN|nr:TIGR03085 family protein [Actinocatenispora comari]